MIPIDGDHLRTALTRFEGLRAYVHLEANPGVLLRNVPANIVRTHVAGEGLYRVAVQTAEGGWIRAEGLTDMETERTGCVLLAGHDAVGRITAALQLRLTPFDFEREVKGNE